MAEAEHLFVYGTLRKHPDSPMHRFLQSYADFVGPGWFRGRLYRVADFPGVIEANDAGYPIRGEVYRLHESETVLRELDKYVR